MNQPFNVHAALRSRYCAPEWAILFEVGNATGFATNRHADAIAMSLWPSRGLHLHGIECKASRSDWVKELKDPAKAESIAQFCDFWWLAVADKAIVKDGELPTAWGLLAPKGDKLVCFKEPAINADKKPITQGFLAAMFRRIHAEAALPEKSIRDKAYQEGYVAGKKDSERPSYEEERLRNNLAEITRSVQEFEHQSGVRINQYSGPCLGEEFKNQFQRSSKLGEIKRAIRTIEDVHQTLRWALHEPELCDYII